MISDQIALHLVQLPLFKDNDKNLELYSCFSWQPMERFKDRFNISIRTRFSDNTCSSITENLSGVSVVNNQVDQSVMNCSDPGEISQKRLSRLQQFSGRETYGFFRYLLRHKMQICKHC